MRRKPVFSPSQKDGLWNVHFQGLIMTEDDVEIMNSLWKPLKIGLNYPP
ncbi:MULTISPECIES: hypothetical protein [Chryseobacterium]|nr:MULTISPECIES: hypothetical protein [Chryseobacterium]MDQ0475550.1 hypothetical protein [Chryseobacterium sp. MDT2-18]